MKTSSDEPVRRLQNFYGTSTKQTVDRKQSGTVIVWWVNQSESEKVFRILKREFKWKLKIFDRSREQKIRIKNGGNTGEWILNEASALKSAFIYTFWLIESNSLNWRHSSAELECFSTVCVCEFGAERGKTNSVQRPLTVDARPEMCACMRHNHGIAISLSQGVASRLRSDRWVLFSEQCSHCCASSSDHHTEFDHGGYVACSRQVSQTNLELPKRDSWLGDKEQRTLKIEDSRQFANLSSAAKSLSVFF